MLDRAPIRVLLVKCYRPTTSDIVSPPLGLLYLAASLRRQFGDDVKIRVVDRGLSRARWDTAAALAEDFQPDVVGFSALNWDAEECCRSALEIRRACPQAILALGGPFAHSNANRICALNLFDWIFDGEADLSFPLAIERRFRGDGSLDDVVGLTWRMAEGYCNNAEAAAVGKPMVGVVEDLDTLPFPAWDLVDFAAYARETPINHMLRGKRYAPVFTSRGCPFLCTYCHDIFGKRFRWRSPENVAAEARLLREKYGVDELAIVDDIFNMNSARMKAVCRELVPLDLHLCFPNGLRFDILDEEGVEALVEAGTYAACVAVETVTPRLQELIKKRLHPERTMQAIGWMAERGVMVRGFFMIGFPTETREEIDATIDFACRSQLSQAIFFKVCPQPGTPIFELAKQIAPDALEDQHTQEYGSSHSWYAAAYGVNLAKIQRAAFLRFYFATPRRVWRLFWGLSIRQRIRQFSVFLRLLHTGRGEDVAALPEALQPLGSVSAPDPQPVTSAVLLHGRRRAAVPGIVANIA
ncbi:MAG: B12-binding domain-containing radical SAM protein [Pirellulales bacterium]|nr:B12-binding domain-containing radical SAM protein [Pirellulales bacterium]